jgi:hypothetical protein
MNRELKVLMLEDDPVDEELAQSEFRKAGVVFSARRVDTRTGFVAALDEFRPETRGRTTNAMINSGWCTTHSLDNRHRATTPSRTLLHPIDDCPFRPHSNFQGENIALA